MRASEIAERIARGEECPCCGEPWRPYRMGGRILEHRPECPWPVRSDDVADADEFAVGRKP